MAKPNLPALIIFMSFVMGHSITTALAEQSTAVNKGVVELETTGSDGISVRIAEDLARLIDDGATRRVLPVVGKGSLQNITDLKYLRGVDMAIVQADVLDYAKGQRLFPGIESITYITKLYNEEFHLLARSDIKNVADLGGQKVNVDLLGSGTAITATRLFDQLKLQITATHDSPQVALDKLRQGEIAAIAFVAGKPSPFFAGLKGDDGLHLIPVPFDSAGNTPYAPTRLTAADYPGLVRPDHPIDTVAIGSILTTADLRLVPERYNNVAKFVEVFFSGFQLLLTPGNHPKWNEVNLATEVPGWRRYDPAAQWLQRNARIADIQDPDQLRAVFSRFIDERRQGTGAAPMADTEKNALFQQFKSWKAGQGR
jgi:TRAP transporter TAXI family solute receptor